MLLVRHAASEAYLDGNLFPLVDGHGDPPLSVEGKQQAERVCARLAGTGVEAIYVSNLRRTAQTAAPLAEYLDQTRGRSAICARFTWANGRAGSSGRWSPKATRSVCGWQPRSDGT